MNRMLSTLGGKVFRYYEQQQYYEQDIEYTRRESVQVFLFKGTVSVISSDSPYKDDNARFTTVPLKALSDQV